MAVQPSEAVKSANVVLPPRIRSVAPNILRWLIFLALYLGLDYIGYAGSTHSPPEINWNLAIGAALTVGYRYGFPALIPIVLASILGDVLFRMSSTTPYATIWHGLISAACVFIPINLARFVAGDAKAGILSNGWATVVLVAIPVSFATSVLQIIGVAFDYDSLSWESVLQVWASDLSGILVIAPLCVLLLELRKKSLSINPTWVWEVAAQLGFSAAFLWLVFVFNAASVREYFYILSIPLIWICLRHGARGAVIANFMLLATMIIFLASIDPLDVRVSQLPMRMLVLILTAFILGLTVEEGRSAARRLRAREQALSTNLKAGETSELAGTLAHELSHPLGAISNYAAVVMHTLERRREVEPELIEIVSRLRNEVRRATETIQRLREFFRSGSLRLEYVDAAQVVKESVLLLSNKFEANSVVVRISNTSAMTYVSADSIQLHSVIHNILINAIDALQESPSKQHIVSISIQRNNTDVEIVVEDSGPGIAPDIADHIFEPMTTTKKDGLGLGLSMSKTIIQAHGGRVSVDKSSLGGAKFIVTLPSWKA